MRRLEVIVLRMTPEDFETVQELHIRAVEKEIHEAKVREMAVLPPTLSTHAVRVVRSLGLSFVVGA